MRNINEWMRTDEILKFLNEQKNIQIGIMLHNQKPQNVVLNNLNVALYDSLIALRLQRLDELVNLGLEPDEYSNDPRDYVLNSGQLAVVLDYAYEMSRCVAPIHLQGHDGGMSDFYKDLYLAVLNGDKFDVVNDELYSDVFNRMKELRN